MPDTSRMFDTTRWLILVLTAAMAGCGGAARTTGPDGTTSSGPSAGVVARIGDHEITLAEVDEKAMATSVQAFQGLYDARKQALDTLVSDHLLESEAAALGITRDSLIEQEVTRKTAPPTAEDVKAFYDQNTNAMRGRSLEEMSAQIQAFLAAQGRQTRMNELLSELRAKNGVNISLEPPRVPVTIAANDPVKGPAGAPVQILEFSDFQ